VAHLAATIVSELLERTALPPDCIDDVIFAQGYANGESPALGRVAALDAGLPVSVPGMQIDRRCGSGLQAVVFAAMCVETGAAEVVLAGGAESMSQAEYYTTSMRWGSKAGHVELTDRLARGRVTSGGKFYPVPGGMIETAENLRREFSIDRQRQDALALRSHQRAVAAQQAGAFSEELIPVAVVGRQANVVIDRDEQPRSDTSMEARSVL
jgi:acetyl-CoA C-acetyltransferase